MKEITRRQFITTATLAMGGESPRYQSLRRKDTGIARWQKWVLFDDIDNLFYRPSGVELLSKHPR